MHSTSIENFKKQKAERNKNRSRYAHIQKKATFKEEVEQFDFNWTDLFVTVLAIASIGGVVLAIFAAIILQNY